MRNLNKVITKLRNSNLTMPCNIAARRVAAGGGNWGRLSKLLDNIPTGNGEGRVVDLAPHKVEQKGQQSANDTK